MWIKIKFLTLGFKNFKMAFLLLIGYRSSRQYGLMELATEYIDKLEMECNNKKSSG